MYLQSSALRLLNELLMTSMTPRCLPTLKVTLERSRALLVRLIDIVYILLPCGNFLREDFFHDPHPNLTQHQDE